MHRRAGCRQAIQVIMVIGLCVGACANFAAGQLGRARISRPSGFRTPVTNFGLIGGTYTGGWERWSSSPAASRRPHSGPLSVTGSSALRPRGFTGGGQTMFGAGLQIRQPGSTLRPLTARSSAYMGFSTVAPAVRIPRRPISLERILALPGTGESVAGVPGIGSERAGATAGLPAIGSLRFASTAGVATGEGAAPEQITIHGGLADRLKRAYSEALSKGISALKDHKFRDALAAFNRARLIDGRAAEPILGLIVCHVWLRDYNQAAALVGGLARRAPAGLAKVASITWLYPRGEEFTAHVAAIRNLLNGSPEDPNLRMLWSFYQWLGGDRRAALAEAESLAARLGPDSAAVRLAEAMRSAMTEK